MWYLPVTDRLRRIFLNPKEAALMTWWDDERKVDDDKIAHPADCSQWQRIDEKHKEFSNDPRNVPFGLSTNGMNPFNERISDHSTWLVILTMYNIPIWLCQKRKYLLLTILISGPQQPGIDIDVFLEPLMQEMERLWRHGEQMYDAFRKEDFICRAITFVTTNDYPHDVCFVWIDQREDGMLGLLGWYYMGVPRCIQEDSLPKEPTLLKDKSQLL